MRCNLTSGRELFRLGYPLQSGQPKIMAAMHQGLVALAQGRRVLADSSLIHDHMAPRALRLQVPGVIETRLSSRRVAIPAQTLVRNVLVHFAFNGQTKGGPAKHRTVPQHWIPARDFHILGVWIPGWPLDGVDDMAPDLLAGRVDSQVIVGEQGGFSRLEAGGPMDVRGARGEIVLHRHGFVPFWLSRRLRTDRRACATESDDEQGGRSNKPPIDQSGDVTQVPSRWISVVMAWLMSTEPLRACAPRS